MAKVKVRKIDSRLLYKEEQVQEAIRGSVELRGLYKSKCYRLKARISLLEKCPDQYTMSNIDVAKIIRDWLEDAERVDYLLQHDEKSMAINLVLERENSELKRFLRTGRTIPDCWGVKHG